MTRVLSRGCLEGCLPACTDFPEVRISAERLDIREFGPGDAGLVREVLRGGGWLPLSTALVETSEYPADVD
jgi:hypothetical protein